MFFLGFLCVFTTVYAQDIKAVPVIGVESETLDAAPEGIVFVELFSSQACIFCPRADRIFTELVRQPNIIGVSCHVDYFDVKKGSLAKKFCTDRQGYYMEALKSGPHYTPQMIMNGAVDVVGYKLDDITEAIKQTSALDTLELSIEKKGNRYTVTVPEMTEEDVPEGGVSLTLMVFDKKHNLMIADGRNKGQRMVYYNIVNRMEDLGSFDRSKDTVNIDPKLEKDSAGFVVVAQHEETGRIIAAGQFKTNSK